MLPGQQAARRLGRRSRLRGESAADALAARIRATSPMATRPHRHTPYGQYGPARSVWSMAARRRYRCDLVPPASRRERYKRRRWSRTIPPLSRDRIWHITEFDARPSRRVRRISDGLGRFGPLAAADHREWE